MSECVLSPAVTPRTTNTPQSQMTGLKSVQFFDNDTLQWSNSASYSPVASQYIIAIYEEGFLLIDYIAQTATEVRNALSSLSPSLT